MLETRDTTNSILSSGKPDATEALLKEAMESMKDRFHVVGDRVELLNTKLASPPDGEKIGPTDPNGDLNITLMVRSKASDKEMDQTLADIANHKRNPLSEAEFNARFGADPQAMQRILKFADDNGLTAGEVDPNSGRILLKGKVKSFNDAFNIELTDFKGAKGISRERTSIISVPTNIGQDVVGIFGLESHPQNPQVQSDAIRYEPKGFGPRVPVGYMPEDVANAYQFPKDSQGEGQAVAIVEFGGGLDLKDNAAYYDKHHLQLPNINIVSIDGGQNNVGQTADDEVALDSQVIGAVAPGAKQNLMFAPNSDQGFVDSITQATFAKPGDTPNSAISISWGAPESAWTPQTRDNLNLAFKKAALKGISVFAATGDKGAMNGTNRFTTDYPASDPYVTATGGTELRLNPDGTVVKETGWSNGGGGISELTPVPSFQKDLPMPVNANKDGVVGRGVPDISGNAAPATGYRIRVHGFETTIGGTSSVAPLYAALVMRMNGALGKNVGYLNPFFYQHGNSDIFKDINSGNNGGYEAGAGWDAATGWGTINGVALQDSLRKDLNRPFV